MADLRCPFCDDSGFDKIGLKHHLGRYCEIFDSVMTMEEEREQKRIAAALEKIAGTKVREQLWRDPMWACPHCAFVNLAIRERCRNCGYDSNAGEFPYYNPLPPYQGIAGKEE